MRKLKRRRKTRLFRVFLSTFLFLMVIFGVFLYKTFMSSKIDIEKIVMPSYVTEDYVPKGIGHSRNGLALNKVNNIVIHYVGNPNTTAKQNRDYFANIGTKVNSHFIIGLDGEVIQCIPLTERSSASNHRNKDTISIEVCHPDTSGKFNEVTLSRLKEFTAWLCKTFNLTEEDVIRHYDVTGKNCPIYFVQNEDEWNLFKKDVGKIISDKS